MLWPFSTYLSFFCFRFFWLLHHKSKNVLHFALVTALYSMILLIRQTEFPLWENSQRSSRWTYRKATDSNWSCQAAKPPGTRGWLLWCFCCGGGCESFVVDSVDVLLGQGINARQTGWGKDAVAPPGREQTLHEKPGKPQAGASDEHNTWWHMLTPKTDTYVYTYTIFL